MKVTLIHLMLEPLSRNTKSLNILFYRNSFVKYFLCMGHYRNNNVLILILKKSLHNELIIATNASDK